MQTIYTVDYLESISKEKLWSLAKENPTFNTARMERELKMPSDTTRYVVKANNSKYDKQFRKYLINFLTSNNIDDNDSNLEDLFLEANKYQTITNASIAKDLNCNVATVSRCKKGKNKGQTYYEIKQYLENIIKQHEQLKESDNTLSYGSNLKELLDEARKYKHLTLTKIADDLDCSISTVSFSMQGKINGVIAYKIKEYLVNIIKQNQQFDNVTQAQDEEKEQEQMTEETLTDTKEMKTYDEFLNFINTQKELPIVKKALDETLSETQNLDKILAKEEFITIETAQELNEKIFANEYTEAEILDFENQYYGTANDDSLKDKIKSFVEKHNLSLETALKLLQISEEDYNKLLEGADKISNKSADKIYKAISAFDEFYHSEKTQNTINNTKNTFVTGVAIASAKGQTILNKGLNKFADFLNKSADKIKNSNSENKDE